MADLFHRVSIRKFKDEAVSNEDIGYILEAAMAAPSAKNQQPWEFYVVENREVLKQLGESSPFSAPAGKAPVAIVTAYREECDLPEFAQIDMSIMMENLWLAADEIGLGGVWLGVAPREERMKDVEKIVGSRRDSVHSAYLLSVTRMRSGPSRIGSIRAGFIM